MPANAVWCNRDEEGNDVYIGRVRHENVMLLVKIVPRSGEATFPYYDVAHSAVEYDVLVNHKDEEAVWVPTTNGKVPSNAVQCGYNKHSKKLYVGRTLHKGVHVPGYVHPHLNCIYYPHGKKEYFAVVHEVLVHNVPQ